MEDLEELPKKSSSKRALSPRRVAAARAIAVAADLIQIALAPAVFGGAASPANDALDVAVGAALIVLVGWHWAFLPTFATELIPFWDLAPTWTAAVWIATRGARRKA